MKIKLRHLVVACALALGCAEENWCEGEGPHEEVCLCPGSDGRDAVEGYADLDGDGLGAGERQFFCGGGFASGAGDCDDADPGLNDSDLDGDGQSACDGDCDDRNTDVRVGADEICDGLDNDCDGELGEGEEDADGDGYLVCDGDCDDDDAAATPDDLDGDGASGCDDLPDCDDTDAAMHVRDDDGDGASPCDGDCDDSDASLNLDDGDGDGSSTCDEDCDDTDPTLEGLDADGDGYSTCDGDCDDGDLSLYPGDLDFDGYSPCDGDCHDGNDTLTPADLDGDGFSTCDGDCDDTDPARNPGAGESCDGIDNDCDGIVPIDEFDLDGDGFIGCDECNDDDATQFPQENVTSGWVRDCAIWLEADVVGSEWYHHRVEQADLVWDGTTLAAYFRTGYWPGDMSIGVTVTTDMVTWQAPTEVLTGTGDANDWDGEGIGNPSVVYDGNDPTAPYKMYFDAENSLTGETNIGLATSADGLSWERYADLDPPYATFQVVPCGEAGDLDALHAAAPFVWIDGSDYHMVYQCSDGVSSSICTADSSDLGYTWTKWDPEPGVGDDPQPLITTGEAGDWDEVSVNHPMTPDEGGTLLYAGSDLTGSQVGAVHMPSGPQGVVTRLDDLNPVFGPAASAGRWDDVEVVADDVWEDGGVVSLLYSGAREDLTVDGEAVVSLGVATNEAPLVTLTGPTEPHVMSTTDEVTVIGTVSDTDALDEIYLVVTSPTQPDLAQTGLADTNGDYSVVVSASTFDVGVHTVTVTAYDAGGLSDFTTVGLVVTP